LSIIYGAGINTLTNRGHIAHSQTIFTELATRFNLPAIIGELLAGVLLGPSLLGWVTPNEVLKLLAELGIILLLFEVGL